MANGGKTFTPPNIDGLVELLADPNWKRLVLFAPLVLIVSDSTSSVLFCLFSSVLLVSAELDPNEKVAGTVVDEPPLVGAPNTKPPRAPVLPLSVVDVPFDGLLKKSNELPPDGAVDLKPPKLAKAPGLPSYLNKYKTTSITSEFDLPNSCPLSDSDKLCICKHFLTAG